jgi:ATP-dependent DNA helicase PIF1
MTSSTDYFQVSMLDGHLFDKLETLARLTMKNGRGFGGIQVILCGDFFQLGPIRDLFPPSALEPILAFKASSWKECITHAISLWVVYRQRDAGEQLTYIPCTLTNDL